MALLLQQNKDSSKFSVLHRVFATETQRDRTTVPSLAAVQGGKKEIISFLVWFVLFLFCCSKSFGCFVSCPTPGVVVLAPGA
jgi:hypothetical protein